LNINTDSTTPNQPIVRLTDVCKTFGTGKDSVNALRNVNLSVPKGSIYGVIGLSGAGKSTLIRCINMLEKPDSGSIEVAGREMTRQSGHELMVARRRIGMIFQHFNLLNSRNVFGNIAFPLEIAGVPKSKIKARVEELIELVGLHGRAKAYPTQLSGGQKQRIGIARALANEPDVLLSDEATSALDPETTIQVLQLIRDINRRTGVTVVMITHEMNVIREICDQVAVMNYGSVVESGATMDVFSRPQSMAAQRLLRSQFESSPATIIPDLSNGDHHKLVKLSFAGASASEPIIAELTRNISVTPNILYGRIDRMQGLPWGTLVVDLAGEPEAIQAALEYLERCEVHIIELDEVTLEQTKESELNV
jgi:D-methionine transport system ATP-binding protein